MATSAPELSSLYAYSIAVYAQIYSDQGPLCSILCKLNMDAYMNIHNSYEMSKEAKLFLNLQHGAPGGSWRLTYNLRESPSLPRVFAPGAYANAVQEKAFV